MVWHAFCCMMHIMEHTIKYYPVGNGDCTLIKLDNDMTIIIDCQITDAYDKDGEQVSYDVKKDLLAELNRDRYGHPYVDLFVSTHPHDDHCVGFKDNFYHGNPNEYNNTSDKGKIIIGELWITPRGMGNDVANSAESIRCEAKRRRHLYDENRSYSGTYGNYLRIIGYDNQKNFDSRYAYVPGTNVKFVNGAFLSLLEIFIHAPFKEDVEDCRETDDKNTTSIVTQFKFKSEDDKVVCRVLMGGDAEHDVWQHILDNNVDDANLQWNIFLAPHHCSWTFFNDSDNKQEILKSAQDILCKHLKNAYVIASSKAIHSYDSNPPCEEAKKAYMKFLDDKDNFCNTATDKVINGIPQPIIFKINEHGKRKITVTVVAGESSISRPAPRAGM